MKKNSCDKVDLKMFLLLSVLFLINSSLGFYDFEPTATNRSKSNNYLFYNRIPKCGSSTAMKVMRAMSFRKKPEKFQWIGKQKIKKI